MSMKRTLFLLLAIVAMFGLVFTTGCRTTKIGDIINNFSDYEGKQVTIGGTVGETVWFAVLERGGFQVGDGSGNIWVITSQPPPQEGQKVSVTGTIQAAFELGGRSFGKVIMETSRR